jgi:hypothetical protein
MVTATTHDARSGVPETTTADSAEGCSLPSRPSTDDPSTRPGADLSPGVSSEVESEESVGRRSDPWLLLCGVTAAACLLTVVGVCLALLPEMWPYYLGCGVPALAFPALVAAVWRTEV